ncbi:hypothetical protein GCM10010140_18050 [Streptosporangium pseudovulgare]|uniref:DUF5753 domain-containing protein n=2 Tax=Streptosporangium pseudovulgare TaxID=35765 RepID=A0ABQ2QQK4_9ACTN|nr:hypothetical protein GCM10010140_18050 [Streptosporangium pseudovulgare]
MHLWAIMNEGVLRRQVGGERVMKEQLNHLVDISAQPNVTLQVLPYAAGAHAAMLGSFATLSFSSGEWNAFLAIIKSGGLDALA